MSKTLIRRHGLARKTILKGVNEIYETVRLTLGPEYGTVLLHRSFGRGSRITNDGVTIAKCIEPKDEFENLVVTAFKEAASKTGERVGDGTTSTIIIAGKLINNAFAQLGNEKSEMEVYGLNTADTGVIALKKRILEAIPKIKEEIKSLTKEIKTQKELEYIADVSLGGDKENAKIIADIIWKLGADGFFSIYDGFSGKVETEITEGAKFPMKIAAKSFLTNPERYEMVAEECQCLITDYAMDNIQNFLSFWNNLKANKLIVFAPNFSDDVLVLMMKIMFPQRDQEGRPVPSGIRIYPVKCPSLGSEEGTPNNFLDLAAYCGATFIKKPGMLLKDIKSYDLGFLQKLTVSATEDRKDASLVGGGGKTKEISERIAMLKAQKEITKLPEHKAFIDKRIGSLCAAQGVVRVGAATDAKALPLKHKIEDALYACQTALRFGYVEGGGLCLKKIAEKLFKNDQLIKDALCAPYEQIQENTGGIAIGKNIIDPAKVVELEAEHGLEVAASLITCKAIIPEIDDRDNQEGSKEIAKALSTYTYLWAKREGLITSGKEEAAKEELQRHERLIEEELNS